MNLFKGKYKIESNRLQGWDYAGNGIYFITIVTQNRECNLGYIEKNKMILSDFSKIINREWLKSFDTRNELILNEYIIMPNHLHAIVILNKKNTININYIVETYGRMSLQNENKPTNPSGTPVLFRKSKSISSFIGGFKSAINTKIDNYIDKNNLEIPKYNRQNRFFQSNYYDHIIRNDKEYYNIKKYIRNNPAHWDDDELRKEKE